MTESSLDLSEGSSEAFFRETGSTPSRNAQKEKGETKENAKKGTKRLHDN
jgi:hypothetical protein